MENIYDDEHEMPPQMIMCDSMRRDKHKRDAEHQRFFAMYLIGALVGLAMIIPGAGLIMLSEHLITSGIFHDILNAAGKIIDGTGILLMFGSWTWAGVQELR